MSDLVPGDRSKDHEPSDLELLDEKDQIATALQAENDRLRAENARLEKNLTALVQLANEYLEALERDRKALAKR